MFALLFCARLAGAATAYGAEAPCAPVEIGPSPTPAGSRVKDYAPVFESCASESGSTRLAIRRMSVDGTPLILTVDPQSLQTSLERAACWR